MMSEIVFWAVLGAALMHAGWNAMVKVGLDRFSSILLLSIVQGGIAFVIGLWLGLPLAASWPWLLASGLLHAGYKIFLIRAYEHGDLSQIYPIARGTAPMIVTLVGIAALGESVALSKLVAVFAIGCGVCVMAVRGGAKLRSLPPTAMGAALATAAFTATYTLVDGIGARHAGSPSAYACWLFVIDGMNMVVYGVIRAGRGAFTGLWRDWKSGLLAGVMSFGSYWIAIWAFTLAPIALVAALRETSVLFAMLIATLILREPAGPWRWVAACLIFAGVGLMRIS